MAWHLPVTVNVIHEPIFPGLHITKTVTTTKKTTSKVAWPALNTEVCALNYQKVSSITFITPTGPPSTSHPNRMANASPSPLESFERESLHDNGLDPDQMDWLAELHSRNAKIVRVLFPRTANNNKELTVVRLVQWRLVRVPPFAN